MNMSNPGASATKRPSGPQGAREMALVSVAVLGLVIGGILWAAGRADLGPVLWAIATVPVLIALLFEIAASLAKADVGLDIIAALSMTAALVFHEPLAANVVALMYSGGQLLEDFAEGRARREMSALLGRVARTAMRREGAGLEEIPIESIEPGDTLLIRQGEVLPVDGRVAVGQAAGLDVSALTGEAIPIRLDAGGEALSGSTSVGKPFDLVAVRPAADSTYAGIVRLVEAAQASKSPMMRLADRYGLVFLVFTVFLAAVAWAISGEPVRALAVLVSATPCPLILAVPVAFISGLSRAAKSGLLVKSGGAFETMARVKVAVLDKTGTLTRGAAEVSGIRTANGFAADEVLRLAASLDQASGHVLATALIHAATQRGLVLSAPNGVTEEPGAGITGMVEGHQVAVGGDGYVKLRIGEGDPLQLHSAEAVSVTVAVAADGELAGVISLTDPVRPDAQAMFVELRKAGISRIVLASGDKLAMARAVGAAVGADEVLADLDPASKVATIDKARAYGPTMMIGDGINDAPALAAADIGIAMGARGSAASSEAAGAVLLVDELAPVAAGLAIARRTQRIALESVWVGLGASVLAMSAAALGYLPPVEGALLQELIDVAVILNALRALR
jgi:heavy metal translocating P-type ATPase